MRSKVEILAPYDTNVYEWERYSVVSKKLHQWDRYLYKQDIRYWWNIYATMTLDQDYYYYHRYTYTDKPNSYAHFREAVPQFVSYVIYTVISIDDYGRRRFDTQSKYNIAYEDFVEDWFNYNSTLGSSLNIDGTGFSGDVNSLDIGDSYIGSVKYSYRAEDANHIIGAYSDPVVSNRYTTKRTYSSTSVGKDEDGNNLFYTEEKNQLIPNSCLENPDIYVGIEYKHYGPGEHYLNSYLPRDTRKTGFAGVNTGEWDNIPLYTRVSYWIKDQNNGNDFYLVNMYVLPNMYLRIGLRTDLNIETRRMVLYSDSHMNCMLAPYKFIKLEDSIGNGYTYDQNSPGLVRSVMTDEIESYELSPSSAHSFGLVQGYVTNEDSKYGVSSWQTIEPFTDGYVYKLIKVYPQGTVCPACVDVIWRKRPKYENWIKYVRTEYIPRLDVLAGDLDTNQPWENWQYTGEYYTVYEWYDDTTDFLYNDINTQAYYMDYFRIHIPRDRIDSLNNAELYLNNNQSNAVYHIPSESYLKKYGSVGTEKETPDSTNLETLCDWQRRHDSFSQRVNSWTYFTGLDAGEVEVGERVDRISSEYKDEYPMEEGVPFNGYCYKYVGVLTLNNQKGPKLGMVTSTQKNYYPTNGITTKNGYKGWYVYQGIRKQVVKTYGTGVLLDNVHYQQSTGSSNQFTIGSVGGASISFDVLKPITEVLPYAGYECKYYVTFNETVKTSTISGETFLGRFWIREITENGFNKTHVVAYDNCSLLDTAAKPILDKITLPITALKLLYTISVYCDIPLDLNLTFINQDAQIETPFWDGNTSCRQVIEYIAEISGSVISCDFNGRLQVKDMKAPIYSRGATEKTSFNLDVSMLPIIKPTAISYKDGETAVIVNGTSEETANPSILDFSKNPFTLIADKEKLAEILRRTLTSINSLGDIYAFTVDVNSNIYRLTCGDSYVVSAEGVVPRRGVLSDISIDSSGVKFISAGEIYSLDGAKLALTDDELDQVLDDVDAYFISIYIERVKVYDPILEEYYIDEHFEHLFTKENGFVMFHDMPIDIEEQFLDVYNGQEITILINGAVCTLKIENGVMTIVNPNNFDSGILAYASGVDVDWTQGTQQGRKFTYVGAPDSDTLTIMDKFTAGVADDISEDGSEIYWPDYGWGGPVEGFAIDFVFSNLSTDNTALVDWLDGTDAEGNKVNYGLSTVMLYLLLDQKEHVMTFTEWNTQFSNRSDLTFTQWDANATGFYAYGTIGKANTSLNVECAFPDSVARIISDKYVFYPKSIVWRLDRTARKLYMTIREYTIGPVTIKTFKDQNGNDLRIDNRTSATTYPYVAETLEGNPVFDSNGVLLGKLNYLIYRNINTPDIYFSPIKMGRYGEFNTDRYGTAGIWYPNIYLQKPVINSSTHTYDLMIDLSGGAKGRWIRNIKLHDTKYNQDYSKPYVPYSADQDGGLLTIFPGEQYYYMYYDNVAMMYVEKTWNTSNPILKCARKIGDLGAVAMCGIQVNSNNNVVVLGKKDNSSFFGDVTNYTYNANNGDIEIWYK